MRRLRELAFVIALATVVASFAHAVSPSPIPEEREEKTTQGIKSKGDIVCLFQSGTADVKRKIHVTDILIVYRENLDRQLTAVGKIKILSYAGEDYLKAEVIEGELLSGDIAKKGNVASLIISLSNKCK